MDSVVHFEPLVHVERVLGDVGSEVHHGVTVHLVSLRHLGSVELAIWLQKSLDVSVRLLDGVSELVHHSEVGPSAIICIDLCCLSMAVCLI